MKFSQDEGGPGLLLDINTTPLIDVMLVLLIMLIVTIPLQTRATRMDLPAGDAAAPAAAVNLVVDPDGTIFWGGEKLADQASLEHHLRAAAVAQPPLDLHLKPNPQAAYRDVLAVLAAAQRLGATRIALIADERLRD